MRGLTGAAGTAIDAARGSATTGVDFARQQARIVAQVASVATLAELAGKQTVAIPGNVDPLVAANAALSKAQGDLSEALRVANAIGAPLSASVTDLIAKFTSANNALEVATADLKKQQDALDAIKDNTAATVTGLSNLKNDLLTKFTALDTTLDGALNFDEFKAGFSGVATDATLKAIFDELDVNGDGQISRLEAIKGSTAGTVSALANISPSLAAAISNLNFSTGGLTETQFKNALTGLASDSTLSRLFFELDGNGNGILEKLEAVVGNTGAIVTNTAGGFASGANTTVSFAPDDPIRSVFNNISTTNSLLIDVLQLQLEQLTGTSYDENLNPEGENNTDFTGTYFLMQDQVRLQTSMDTYLFKMESHLSVMRSDVDGLRAEVRANVSNTKKTADILDRITQGGTEMRATVIA
jgi:hypothetical protein